MAEFAVSCEGLSRRFADQIALDGLDLSARPGEVLALLGPNGAGKTTTVRLLNGVLTPDAGSARVLGLDPVTQGEAVRARTGVLTEQSGLDDRLTAMENVVTHARLRRMDLTVARAKAGALLEQFGMAERIDSLVQGFSTGQRKRVGLARALIHDPEVLFLDEPTSGLDPEATRDTLDLIADLARDHGRTVILCTHFLAEAGRLCTRMAVLSRGRLLGFGTPAELATRLGLATSVALDLGQACPAHVAHALERTAGVVSIAPTPTGARLTIDARPALPVVARTLCALGIELYGMTVHAPGLEDVYFELTADRHAMSVGAMDEMSVTA